MRSPIGFKRWAFWFIAFFFFACFVFPDPESDDELGRAAGAIFLAPCGGSIGKERASQPDRGSPF